ncbi:MAG TPA: hypothetical protein VF016_05065 [Nitrososphaera sp.]
MTAKDNLKLLAFMAGAALFFAVTLLASFFAVIVFIGGSNMPRDQAPNFFMVGLVPPSVATFVLFTKGFGRFM